MDNNQFIPDRRGLSQIYISSSGKETTNVQQCIRGIAKFIRQNQKRNQCNPVRLTCRVMQLEQSRMNWHIHYEREDWCRIIENTEELNCYIENITEKEMFFKVLEMIDVFKHCYAKQGWDIHHEQIVNWNIARDDNEEKMEPKEQYITNDNEEKVDPIMSELNQALKKMTIEDEMKIVRQKIKNNQYKISNIECRIWRKMKSQENGKISLEAEISGVIKMSLCLKRMVNTELFLKDMRFGLDFESRSSFVEIRPRGFFKLYQGSINSFNNKFRSIGKHRFKNTQNKLIQRIGESKFNKLKQESHKYFTKHPELFEWHSNKH